MTSDSVWSGWIEWSGGECPVNPGTETELKCQGGGLVTLHPEHYVWGPELGGAGRIVAYRYKIKEPESDMHPDLRWLAENVSEWPSTAKAYSHGVGWHGWNHDGREPDFIRRVDPLSSEYTKSQWLQARIDLGLTVDDDWTPGEEEAWQAKEREIGGNRTAENFLHHAANLMTERGKQYDQPGGERSMGKAVAALNAITGRDLAEAEGWLLMSLVKRVRQYSGTGYHKDSAEDAVAYSALEAEALESVR